MDENMKQKANTLKVVINDVVEGEWDDMTFDKDHTDNHCDRCQELKGHQNLERVPFLYLDKNDHIHDDISLIIGAESGYHQYYVCKDCWNPKWGKFNAKKD